MIEIYAARNQSYTKPMITTSKLAELIATSYI